MLLNEQLSTIRELYKEGRNIMAYLRVNNNTSFNSREAVMISYDFQAGSYIKLAREKPGLIDDYTSAIASVLQKYSGGSILEAGVGEATTLSNVVRKLDRRPEKIYGFDISWSRMKYAVDFAKENGIADSVLFTGDLFNAPFRDSSVDLVYTAHTIEPNGGKEREALTELYRITKNYLILFEPSYEFAKPDARERMIKNGYVTKLHATAIELGYKIIEHRLLDVSTNPMNPTGIIAIEKLANSGSLDNPLACPVTHSELKLINGSYFSERSLLAYPVVGGIPCLLPDNAILACHYM